MTLAAIALAIASVALVLAAVALIQLSPMRRKLESETVDRA